MIDRDRMVKTLCDLVQIDSPSGEEEAFAVELKRRLEALGFGVVRDSYGNLIASQGGPNPVMLSGHMDTVEPGRGIKPRVEGDRVLSDGTTVLGGDNKAGIAVILETLESLREDGTPRVPVEVVLTRQEETALIGARNLDFSMITAKEAIVFDREGPVNQVTSSAPTYISFDVSIKGRAAHAGIDPERGISAVRIAAEIITRLPQGRLDETTTFNVGAIEGGSVRNAVPETAVVKGEYRATRSETLDSLGRQLMDAIGEARRAYPEATVKETTSTEFETFSLNEDDPCAQRVFRGIRSIGLEPVTRPSGGGSDANVFHQHGISAVVVGFAVYNMHSVQEYVSISELFDTARLCEAVLKN